MQIQSPLGVWAIRRVYVTVFCRMLNECTLPYLRMACSDIWLFEKVKNIFKAFIVLYNGSQVHLHASPYHSFPFNTSNICYIQLINIMLTTCLSCLSLLPSIRLLTLLFPLNFMPMFNSIHTPIRSVFIYASKLCKFVWNLSISYSASFQNFLLISNDPPDLFDMSFRIFSYSRSAFFFSVENWWPTQTYSTQSAMSIMSCA